MSHAHLLHIEPFGERGWLARLTNFSNDIESGLFANAAADTLRELPGVTDAVAGIDSITIRFDPTQTDAETSHRHLQNTIETLSPKPAKSTKEIDIPVLYGGSAGPDFKGLCQSNNLSAEQLIDAHTKQHYRVITLGFAPGFAYMGPLDECLQATRLETPRPRLAAGSVGVAGAFTGVYSLPSPGGWRIIGRTPRRLFDATNPAPFVFEPGAEVRFWSISKTEFDQIEQQSV